MTLREMQLAELNANLAGRMRLREVAPQRTNSQKRRESRPFDMNIELPGGQVVNLREASAKQATEAEKAEFDGQVKAYESLGIPTAGAEAAARGREQRGW